MTEVDCYVASITRAENPITTPIFKLGGNPVFISHVEQPICKHCGQKMDFIGQIPLDSPLDFASRYRMAYIFMCPGKFDSRGWLECETWEAFGGANAVVLQDNHGHAVVPDSPMRYPDYGIILVKAREPNIDTTDYTIEEQVHEQVSGQTKLGGVPMWIQTNETPNCPICAKPMRFIAQIDAELDGPLPVDTTQ